MVIFSASDAAESIRNAIKSLHSNYVTHVPILVSVTDLHKGSAVKVLDSKLRKVHNLQ